MAATAAALLVHRRWSLPVAAVGIAYGVLSLRRRLPETPGRDRLAVQLCAQGLGWTVRQEAALLLRHWWPLTALLAPHSALLRRALAASLVVDVVVAQVDNPGTRYRPLARRLDDMAYGAGLWAGAIRARSVTCLLPRRPGQKTGQGGTSPNG
jgi:mycofactocin glycosyltransferase